MSDSEAGPTTTLAAARAYALDQLIEFASDRRVRKKLFKTDQLWTELLCYEPGQSTVMHHHPYEEELFVILQGTATMQVGEETITLSAGSLLHVDAVVPHGLKNLGTERLIVLFTKVPTKLAKRAREAG